MARIQKGGPIMKRLLFIVLALSLATVAPAQNKKKIPLHFKPAAPTPAPRIKVKTGPYTWTATYSPLNGIAWWPWGVDYGNYIAGALDLNDSTTQQGPITITGLGISASHLTQALDCTTGACVLTPCQQPATWELWSAVNGGEQNLVYSFQVPNQTQPPDLPYTGSVNTSIRSSIAVPAGSYILATYNLGYNNFGGSDMNQSCQNYFSQLTVQYTIP